MFETTILLIPCIRVKGFLNSGQSAQSPIFGEPFSFYLLVDSRVNEIFQRVSLSTHIRNKNFYVTCISNN